MNAYAALRMVLATDAAVTALIQQRSYPEAVPHEQGLPAVAYSRASTQYEHTFSTPGESSVATMEIWCMGDDRVLAEEVGDAVEAACCAAFFTPVDRRGEYDPDEGIFSSVLIVEIKER